MYVCQNCIKDLNNESLSRCTCTYGFVYKNKPNLDCPYHREKYLTWLDDNGMIEEYNKIVYPEKEKQQNYLPSSASTFTSTTYQPATQSLSTSLPSQKRSSEKAIAKEQKKRAKEHIKRTKSERKERRSSQGKATSAPSSLRSSADKQVRFGIVPDVIEGRPRVMRRGTIPTQQQNVSSSEEEKEKMYEKRSYHSDNE
jgi:hypothetical protein